MIEFHIVMEGVYNKVFSRLIDRRCEANTGLVQASMNMRYKNLGFAENKDFYGQSLSSVKQVSYLNH